MRDSVPDKENEMALETEPAVQRRRFTLEEYLRMGEVGILGDDERVELIEGEIVEMTPIGLPHGSVVARLTMLLTRRLADPPIVWVQGPLALRGRRSQLQPDVVLLRPKADFYRSGHPEPEDILLVIEVMDTSMQRDQRIKRPLYAQAGVSELWLVDVNADTIEVCREPAAGAYANVTVLARGSTVTPLAFPDLTLRIDEILG